MKDILIKNSISRSLFIHSKILFKTGKTGLLFFFFF
jgi:hypothetical protein